MEQLTESFGGNSSSRIHSPRENSKRISVSGMSISIKTPRSYFNDHLNLKPTRSGSTKLKSRKYESGMSIQKIEESHNTDHPNGQTKVVSVISP